MRLSLIFQIACILVLTTAACTPVSQETPVPTSIDSFAPAAPITSPDAYTSPNLDIIYTSPNLDITYANALPAYMQLALGTLKLAETGTPVTPEQAAKFLPLWQALQSMTSSGNSASAEVTALLGQIESIFTAEQLAAIKIMKLTSTEMSTWAKANANGMSPETKATHEAKIAGRPSNSPFKPSPFEPLAGAIIRYLETLK